ncbi:MAG: mandelate racemase/muconate lactonizing enzyme family protein [Acidimicrobiia bacterium]|nr:mandelate racemase/muconate lactonizing enzyme family protein [Acidimicrobiia bacterium]
MKITDIKSSGLTGATPLGGWAKDLGRDDVAHTIIAVHTDDGLVGIGSVFSSAALVEGALATLAPLYMGENALEPDRVSEKLHQHTFWFGRGGTVTHTISGINIALWDLLGQATGQPVGRLMGGRYRDRVQPYASILADEPAPMRDELERLRSLGFRAFKIGWGPLGRQSAHVDHTIVRTARETVGADVILAVDPGASDAHWSHGYKWALRTAQMLADYDVAWFEEALPPDDLLGYTELRRLAPVPIAGGEVLTRRQEFARYLQEGAFDIVQPDTTKGGGLSESRRIGWTAELFGARLIPHGWNTAVGLVADLHLASALSSTDLVEYKTGSPYIDDLTVPGFRLDADGMLEIPAGPGLGVRLDQDALGRWGTSDLGLHDD